MFCGFKSRCTILLSLRYVKAEIISLAILLTSFYFIRPTFFREFARSLGAYYKIKKMYWSDSWLSFSWMMFGCLSFFRICISCFNSSNSLLFLPLPLMTSVLPLNDLYSYDIVISSVDATINLAVAATANHLQQMVVADIGNAHFNFSRLL